MEGIKKIFSTPDTISKKYFEIFASEQKKFTTTVVRHVNLQIRQKTLNNRPIMRLH